MAVKSYRANSDMSWSGFDKEFPCSLCYTGGRQLQCPPGDTMFLFIYCGPVEVVSKLTGRLVLHAGMYAQLPEYSHCVGGEVVAFMRHGYRGVFLVGGPVESQGRLKYIDGCTDSLILPPSKLGDPCLNHLHFPRDIEQTTHTHPSARLGIVFRGRGECDIPDKKPLLLAPGVMFSMTPGSPHKFKTTDSMMDIIAFHPDSDTGPTDDDHPMIRRTLVDGKPANLIPEIRTRSS
jgi:hypothetical protein